MAFLVIATEFFGGIALIAGFLTRVAAVGIAIDMVVAVLWCISSLAKSGGACQYAGSSGPTGDDGKGMLNYANLVGLAIDGEMSNLYVPGDQTNLPAGAARYRRHGLRAHRQLHHRILSRCSPPHPRPGRDPSAHINQVAKTEGGMS
jgi:hypothetical protein